MATQSIYAVLKKHYIGITKMISTKGGEEMLFLEIITWDPKDDMETGKRYMEWKPPEGYNILGAWNDVAACRAFFLFEADNAEAFAAAAFPWRDITRMETVQVMETKKFMEIVAKYRKM